MAEVSAKMLASGKMRHVVDTDPNDIVLVLKPDAFYRLGGQVEDIVATHVITESELTYWCSITQGWV